MSDRYLIVHLVRHSPEFYALSPEEEASSQHTINAFILSWAPKVRLIIGAHALGMTGDWDWMGVFAVDELADWEAMREEYRRRFPHRVEASLSLPGVAHALFRHATENVEHYRILRELGAFPGGAEATDAARPI
ncbi:MAG: hypothetical protein WBD40_12810 [Tepidisphaeraceae bacterium]